MLLISCCSFCHTGHCIGHAMSDDDKHICRCLCFMITEPIGGIPAYAPRILKLGGIGYSGACDGDQGAPLILTVDSDPRNDILVGISSFGSPTQCGPQNPLPDVFTDVSAFADFVRSAAGLRA